MINQSSGRADEERTNSSTDGKFDMTNQEENGDNSDVRDGNSEIFLNKLDVLLEKKLNYNSNFMVLGDFNFKSNEGTVKDYRNIFSSYNLVQQVFTDTVTESSRTSVDNLFTKMQEGTFVLKVVKLFMSDHTDNPQKTAWNIINVSLGRSETSSDSGISAEDFAKLFQDAILDVIGNCKLADYRTKNLDFNDFIEKIPINYKSLYLHPTDAQENWTVYSEKLDQYFEANSIRDEKKRTAVLLSLVGTYKLLRDLTFPNLPKEKSYVELSALLTKQYSPHVAVFRERVKFYEAKQTDTESTCEWSLAVNCKFNEHLDFVLKDRLICGMRRGRIQDRLCEESEGETLEKLLTIAGQRE
ncbi:hypothetical protein JTB14_017338 [Gonioctena quinquepunctata]|nr:hypothetical protein JTB14_017338 [Gonioctena quinquepunctata]